MDKKKYQTPQIKEVKLSPEDAVLSNCKNTGTVNSKSGRCQEKAACTNRIVGS